MKLSVIIPTLNEEKRLPGLLNSLSGKGLEIIVADGGSHDGTAAIARSFTPLVEICPPGRGIQMACGARLATGDVLIFLHADTLLPEGFPVLIERALQRPGAVFGAFKLDIRPISPSLCLIRLGANLRTRLFSLPYGDQAVFVRRSVYEKAGGFSPIPIMEDVELALRLKKAGRFVLVRAGAVTSSRRWEKEGTLRAWLRNQSLLWRYLLGAPPEKLLPRYRPVR